jgi:hypothetical protein
MEGRKNNKNNPDLSQAKAEYIQIKASEKFRSKIVKDIHSIKPKPEKGKKRRFRWVKYIATSAAAFILTLGIMVNALPVFADTVAGIPGMSGVVKVLTFGHYEYHQNGMDASVDTAKINGLLDKALEKRINNEFAGYADAVISEFEAEAKSIQKDNPGETVHFGMDSGYEVLTNTKEYLAIDIYLVNTVGSSSTVHKYYTIEKKTQKLLALNDLFLANSDYTAVLGKYVLNEMKHQNASGQHFYWIDEPGYMPNPLITPDSLFYINSTGQLVICFEKYAVAPGSEGTPTFTIPNDVIATIRK